MSDPTTVDTDRYHLYPAFRTALHLLLADMQANGMPMVVFEGYRSAARQTWLYEQGRTRTGAIVTDMQVPRMHGVGLAADCYPAPGGELEWSFTPAELHQYHLAMQRNGLRPTNLRGDYGHVELDVAMDGPVHAAAAKWVADGFKP